MKYAALLLALAVQASFAETDCDRTCAQLKADKEFQEADAQLNRVYRQAMSLLSTQQRSKLLAEQRRWMDEVRDNSCVKRTEKEWGGPCSTTWCVIAEEQCRVSETQERTKQLEKMVVRGQK